IHKLLWRNWAIYKIFNFHFYFPLKPKLQLAYNARLRGWQRITTKLKHNNRNHFGSLGLETPRVDSPF
ncbi:hypothetical protein, partial [Vibrio cholerae]|uniref:hypothetical protein n=1 Tax=Vibrio cholerae TaxID=666 RepID=UPI00307FF3DE